MNCPRISQKLLKRNCPCRSVLVRGCYLLPRTFTDRHGLIGRLCESVLVRGHYFLPRTYTDQHGLIRRPCESVLVRGHCFLPRTYTDQHGLKVVCASPCLSVAIVFATDVHRLTRTDGQQYLVFYALMKGACGDSPMSYPAKRAKARALQRMRELALGNFLENSAHEKRRLSRKYLIFAVSMWWQGHQSSNPLKLKAL